jgi:hypothetical protein
MKDEHQSHQSDLALGHGRPAFVPSRRASALLALSRGSWLVSLYGRSLVTSQIAFIFPAGRANVIPTGRSRRATSAPVRWLIPGRRRAIPVTCRQRWPPSRTVVIVGRSFGPPPSLGRRRAPGRNAPRRDTPRRGTPRRGTPWRDAPWRNTPWRDTPWRDTPWRKAPRRPVIIVSARAATKSWPPIRRPGTLFVTCSY